MYISFSRYRFGDRAVSYYFSKGVIMNNKELLNELDDISTRLFKSPTPFIELLTDNLTDHLLEINYPNVYKIIKDVKSSNRG